MSDPKRAVFDKIKSSCIELSRHALRPQSQFDPQSDELASSLSQLVKALNDLTATERESCDHAIGDYLYFPMQHLLSKDSLGDRASEKVLEVLAFILAQCWTTNLSPETARTLLAVTIYLVSGPPPVMDAGKPSSAKPTKEFLAASDELRMAGCKAMDALFKAGNTSGIKQTDLASVPTLAHNITVLLDCLEYGTKMPKLQLAAVRTLDTLLFITLANPDAFSLVLPGIMSRVVKLVTGKYGRVHFDVTAAVLRLLAELVPAVFRDTDFAEGAAPRVHRTEQWLRATKEQVKIALNSISVLRTSGKSDVQGALVDLAVNILTRSSASLDNCIPVELDTVVYFSSISTDVDVQSRAVQFLSTEVVSSPSLKESLGLRTYDWIESLPRLLSSHDDSQSVLVSNSISSAIHILDDESSPLIETFIRTLENSVSLEPNTKAPVASTDLFASGELTRTVTVTKAYKSSISFDDLGVVPPFSLATQQGLERVLHSVGASSKSESVISSLLMSLEVMSDSDSSVKTTVLWAVYNVLKGSLTASSTSDWLADDVRASSTEAELNVLFYCRNLIQSGTSIRFGKQPDALSSLSLRCVSLIAEHLGTEFREELVESLYPIVELLGSSNGIVARQAQQVITQIAQSCEYDSVQRMLVENADILIDAISVKMNTLDISPRSTTILSIMISLAGPAIAPYMDDLVSTMFLILDEYHGYAKLTQGVFGVFRTLIRQIDGEYAGRLQITSTADNQVLATIDDLISVLSKKADIPDLVDDVGEEEQEVNEEPTEEIEEEPKVPSTPMETPEEQDLKKWTSPVPKTTFKVVEAIVDYSDKYLTHESAKLKYQLLDLISSATPVLSSSQEDFLPMVNKVWPVIVARLQDDDVFLVEAALKCIGTLSSRAADFMTTRIVHLWPEMRKLLPKSTGSRFSTSNRLLLALFDCIAAVLSSTPVPEDLFDDLLYRFVPYLGRPEAVELLGQFERINSDAVWLELQLKPRPGTKLLR